MLGWLLLALIEMFQLPKVFGEIRSPESYLLTQPSKSTSLVSLQDTGGKFFRSPVHNVVFPGVHPLHLDELLSPVWVEALAGEVPAGSLSGIAEPVRHC